jgi:hypothetical protein
VLNRYQTRSYAAGFCFVRQVCSGVHEFRIKNLIPDAYT